MLSCAADATRLVHMYPVTSHQSPVTSHQDLPCHTSALTYLFCTRSFARVYFQCCAHSLGTPFSAHLFLCNFCTRFVPLLSTRQTRLDTVFAHSFALVLFFALDLFLYGTCTLNTPIPLTLHSFFCTRSFALGLFAPFVCNFVVPLVCYSKTPSLLWHSFSRRTWR
jgi:hypothetical protein